MYIFNDIPIIWIRRPTNNVIIIIISGRALMEVAVVLLFEGGIVVRVRDKKNRSSVFFVSFPI